MEELTLTDARYPVGYGPWGNQEMDTVVVGAKASEG